MSLRWVVGVLLLVCAGTASADCTPAALLTEVSTDPATLGYATAYGGAITSGSAGNDQAVLAALNAVRQGAAYQVQRTLVPAYELAAQMAPAEFAALTQTKLQQLVSLFAPLQVDVSSQNVRDILFNGASAIFPNPGVTRTNLIGIVNKQVSRAELPAVCGRLVTLSELSFAIRGAQ
jgi:hypothetical protein